MSFVRAQADARPVMFFSVFGFARKSELRAILTPIRYCFDRSAMKYDLAVWPEAAWQVTIPPVITLFNHKNQTDLEDIS
jgi:hypothetical protein